MPNTGLGTPYVTSTDLVANYPTVSSDLADHIDEVSVNSFATSTARSTAIPTPVEGQVSYLEDINIVEAYTGAAWTAVSNILQVVRATDTTNRTTTSTAFVDANLSVTITPKKSSSAIILIASYYAICAANDLTITVITTSSNTAISGAETVVSGDLAGTSNQNTIGVAYATPATTTATTYKLRFRSNSGGIATLSNSVNTAQLFAIEVAA